MSVDLPAPGLLLIQKKPLCSDAKSALRQFLYSVFSNIHLQVLRYAF